METSFDSQRLSVWALKFSTWDSELARCLPGRAACVSILASHFLIVAPCLFLHHSSAGFSVTQQQLSAWKDSRLSVSHPVSRMQMGWEPALFSVFCSCTLLAPCPRILAWYSSCFSNSESLENRTFYLHQLPTCMQDCFAGFLKRHFCFSPGNRPVCLCFQKESSSS